MTGKKKKKTGDTLSLREKEIIKNLREMIKRASEEDKKKSLDTLEEYICNAEKGLLEVINFTIEEYYKALGAVQSIEKTVDYETALKKTMDLTNEMNKITTLKLSIELDSADIGNQIKESVNDIEIDDFTDIYDDLNLTKKARLKAQDILEAESKKSNKYIMEEALTALDVSKDFLEKTISKVLPSETLQDINLIYENKFYGSSFSITLSDKNIDTMEAETYNGRHITISPITVSTISSTKVLNQGKEVLEKKINKDLEMMKRDQLSKKHNIIPTILEVVVDNPDIKIDISGHEAKVKVNDDIIKNYNYKDLNKMAINNGYEKDRSNGDHAIWIKKVAGVQRTVVIPQGRAIGLSLQKKIINDIILN